MLTLTDSLRIRYQPIIRLFDMRPDAVEVLVRTIDIQGALSGPESVVDAMTNSETSMNLTQSIMQRAVAEYTDFQFNTLNLSFGFNLPLDAMLHPDLIVIIETIRNAAGLHPRSIGFELTERHPVHDIARVNAVITVLRETGYSVSLDDITPGMHNLDALLTMPIRAVKLDSSICNSKRPVDLAFISRIAAYGKTSRKSVVAEGIESTETLQRLRKYGVSHGQGFLFARPLQASALRSFLEQFHQAETALKYNQAGS